MTRIPLFALVLLALSGCAGYEMSDDVDWELDFFDLLHGDDLHSPYAPGATVTLWAEPYGGARDDVETWGFVSTDPSVARVVSSSGDRASVLMVSPGVAEIRLVSGGEILEVAAIEVGTPVEAELMWHGDLLVGHPEQEARVEDARVLVGETGAFLVRFRDADGRLLSGNGALGVTAPEEAGAATELTFLSERRDWLMLTPSVAGEHEVALSAGSLDVDMFLLTAVEGDAVARVVLEGESEANHRDGDRLVVVAHAEDDEGRSILGIDYAWDVDGDAVAGFGDVLRYTFDSRSPMMVGASYGDQRAQVQVRTRGDFVVSDSADVGCSASAVDGVSASVPLTVLSILFTWRRRSRRDARRPAAS